MEYIEVIHNVMTDEIIERKMTPAEISAFTKLQTEANERALKEIADIEAKETARKSALAKLAALGLSEEEIAAL